LNTVAIAIITVSLCANAVIDIRINAAKNNFIDFILSLSMVIKKRGINPALNY